MLMDCWFFPIHHLIDEKFFSAATPKPIIFNYTQQYHSLSDAINFPQESYFKKVLAQLKEAHRAKFELLKIDHLVMKNTHHDHQTDICCVYPLELDGIAIPRSMRKEWTVFTPRSPREVCRIHQSFAWSWLSFLARFELQSRGLNQGVIIERLIEPMREVYFDY